MSTTQCATDPGLADSEAELAPTISQGASKPLKRVLVGFAATVTIGLALASWYVGVRIVDANEAVPVSTAVNTQAPTRQATPGLQPGIGAGLSTRTPSGPSTPEDAIAEAYWYTVAPPPPDLYLEVAGLGARKDSSFVKGLEAKGYRARVAQSATESAANLEGSRILIGPFAGRRALEKAERKLQSAGVLAVETTY
jgi:cell division septation protein DedD